jgi:hypothetical protein
MRRTTRRGSAATEFAIWLPIILAIVSGIIDGSWYMHQYQQVSRAAVDAAEVGANIDEYYLGGCLGDYSEPASVTYGEDALKRADISCGTSTCVKSRAHDDNGYNEITVSMSVPWSSLFGFIDFSDAINIEFSATFVSQDADPTC